MRTAIVGVGNSLMKDDGVGVHAIRALQDEVLPEGTELIDAGTDPDVAFDLDDFDRIVLIDAAYGGERPGTVYRFPADTPLDEQGSRRRACHDVGLLETLQRIARKSADVIVFGVEPSEIDWGLDLSSPVRKALPGLVEIIREEVGQQVRRSRCS